MPPVGDWGADCGGSGMATRASLPALICKKRDGERLEEEEIQSFVHGVTEGTVQQGQIGGCMAGWRVKDTKGTGH